MSGYLIDTNVISEYNRDSTPHPGVVKWMAATIEIAQYLSVLTLAEIEKGILLLDEGKRRFTILQVTSLEEAIEWVKRAPNCTTNGEGEVEIRQIYEMEDFAPLLSEEQIQHK